MPRRRRAPKARIGGAGLTPAQRAWFFNKYGEFELDNGDRPCLYAHEVVFPNAAAARAAWEAHRDELLEEYEAAHPGERPWPATHWDDPSSATEIEDEDPDPDDDIPEIGTGATR